MVRQVQPLRISKTTPSSSPNKMPAATSRPLSEIGSTERRRNSPSYNQATKKMIVSRESSPYTENSSPPAHAKSSPRDYWTGRDPMSPSRFDSENSPQPDVSPSLTPKRRPSVERLMQASRVKNSNIFALESKDAYDPSTLPIVERPSANRPLSQSLANNSFARFDSLKKENNPLRSPGKSGHKRGESQTELPFLTPTKSPASVPLPTSPDKEKQYSPSPTKSSLARSSQFGIPALDTLGLDNYDGERVPTPRQQKSVTFHEEPPVVNEYEEQTPEPSISVASDREGSWDSEDFDDHDISFERGSSAEVDRDDSFDADLENAYKTPVVLPEDWSRMSPDEARTDLVNDEDDVFEEGEPTERGFPTRVASDSEARPLPPIPPFMQRERSGSGSLASTAERAAQTARTQAFSPPKRASCSKEEILQMIGKSSPAKETEAQEKAVSMHGEVITEEALTVTNLDTGETREVQVKETEVEEDSIVADLSEFTKAPPRISRESILRKVRNSKYDFEDFDDEDDDNVEESELVADEDNTGRPSIAELAKMDPDQPIPSRENSRETSDSYKDVPAAALDDEFEEVKIKDEPTEEDEFDMNSIPAATEQRDEASRSPSRMDDYNRQSSVLRHGGEVSDEDEDEEDSSSRYSSTEPDAESSMIRMRQEPVENEDGKETLQDAMQLLTVKDYGTEVKEPTKQGSHSGDFVGLPAYLSTDDFDFGMKDFITPSPQAEAEQRTEKKVDAPKMPDLQPAVDVKRDTTPQHTPYVEREVSPPNSPDSVIRHDDGQVSPIEEQKAPFTEPAQEETPAVPERVASIKTPGGKLKARPSATPADLEAMAEQRRIVSDAPPVPPLPRSFESATAGAENDVSSSTYSNDREAESIAQEAEKPQQKERRKSRKSGGRMDLSFLDASTFTIGDEEDEGLGLDEDFDRVIEAQKVSTAPFPPPLFARFDDASQHRPQRDDLPQSTQVYVSYDSPISPYKPHSCSAGANVSTRTQKGYLMRQNTKVVVASNRNVSGESNDTAKSGSTTRSDETAPPMSPTNGEGPRPSSRGTRSANSSPRKASDGQFLKTEPWNGKIRRRSVRVGSPEKDAIRNEPAPPLPGHESALGVVDEDYAAGSASLEDDVGEGVERGRLFVKVVGVKDLDLPMPKNDRIYFQLTLDNGLHCVTTASLELGTNAPIGQEFELVVLNDLEFQLTLTTKLPPPPQPTPPSSSGSMTKSPAKNQKSSGFARFLSSPKKRAEKERQEREAAEAEERRLQEEARKKRLSVAPTAWDLLRELVHESDGSFARAYVNLNAHEKSCFGRQLTVDIPCYNEWALEKDAQVVASVRSKRGTINGPVRRPPYIIGQLQLQLLYVPKPKNAVDEDLPKSMSAAIREMKKVGDGNEVVHEGHLSQQGGDCTHWRRRFFRLQGTKLTAYHEHTHQKRAVINLSKASRLVDDKRMLTANPSPVKTGGKGRRKSAFAEEDEAYQYVEEGFRMRFANGETIDFYADNIARKDEWMVALGQVIGKPDTSQKPATWTDLVLARERAGGRPDSAGSSSSPVKAGVPEVKDFGRPPIGQRQQSKTSVAQTSKSAPPSPMKGPPPRNGPVPPAAAPPARPKTPPMSPRKGHRSRYAVKSMLF